MSDIGYRVLKPQDLEAAHGLRAFALDVLNGLSETPKRLSSRWIYDDEGSRLFSRICELDEYYPTRSEASRRVAVSHYAGFVTNPWTRLVIKAVKRLIP